MRICGQLALCLALTGIFTQAARADDATADSADYSLFDPVPDAGMRSFCTDRPTKGTGPCTVDAGHLQIESDIFNVTLQNSDGIATDTYVYTSPNFRLGITDNMDVEMNVSPLVEVTIHDHNTGQRTDISGFGDIFLRVKTNLAGNGSGDFGMALDPYLKLPTAPVGIGNGAVEGGLVAPLAFALSDVWSLSVVPEIDVFRNALDDNRHANGALSLGVTRTISDAVSLSAEIWGDVDGDPSGTVAQESFDIAGTWQPPGITALQFDAGANFGLNANTPGAQLYMGVSDRF
jgi:hypothetical protein